MFFSLFLTAEAMHFLAIGDWGGSSDSKPVTGAEKDNANGMAATAVALGGIRFVLGEGDNFWHSWRRALSALHRWLRERFPAARAPGPVLRNRWQPRSQGQCHRPSRIPTPFKTVGVP